MAHKDPGLGRTNSYRVVFIYVSRSRCKTDRGQTRSRVPIPGLDPSSPRRPCVAAGSRGPRDHESCRPLSRGSDSSNQVSLLSSRPFLHPPSPRRFHGFTTTKTTGPRGLLFAPYHFSLLLLSPLPRRQYFFSFPLSPY